MKAGTNKEVNMQFNVRSLILAVFTTALFPSLLNANPPDGSPEATFEQFLERYENFEHGDLLKKNPPPEYLERLSFEPTLAKYYDVVVKQLQLTKEEQEIFRKNGFVSVDHGQPYSFASAYYAIYTRDLPVLVTTDSILHAMHKSYDAVLKELEVGALSPMIGEILAQAHRKLESDSKSNIDAALDVYYRDADVYLTVGRLLLAGAGRPKAANERISPRTLSRIADKVEKIRPVFAESRAKIDEIIANISELKIQTPSPATAGPTEIYGGRRYVDYSQFKPRGHYTESLALKEYFRTMMWIGRADTAFNILPPNPQSGLSVDSDRELKDAALIAQLIARSGGEKALASIDRTIAFLVGESDNLKVEGMRKLLGDTGMSSFPVLAKSNKLDTVRKALETGRYGAQNIRSQVITSYPGSSRKVPPPDIFQLFGQRFVLDSFVLSKVVFDSIVNRGVKVRRYMPTGLDVAVAFGNVHALPLLDSELRRWNYAANLQASMDLVSHQPAALWQSNLYNIWLDCLRQLPRRPDNGHFPEVMRTRAWQMKQLQTQLSSWAELRRDTILYAKPSYSAYALCEYPYGYVEPYPDLYARIGGFAATASKELAKLDLSELTSLHIRPEPPKTNNRKPKRPLPTPADGMTAILNKQSGFFDNMSKVLGKLEALARKELAAEPFTKDEVEFLRKTIDNRGGGSGPPKYTGWYVDLLYDRKAAQKFKPTVADVHTDPNPPAKVLEVGVGSAQFIVAAIDNEKDRTVYVGPGYSYYEFHQPADNRLDDDQWRGMLSAEKEPDRPEWVKSFQGPRKKRKLERVKR